MNHNRPQVCCENFNLMHSRSDQDLFCRVSTLCFDQHARTGMLLPLFYGALTAFSGFSATTFCQKREIIKNGPNRLPMIPEGLSWWRFQLNRHDRTPVQFPDQVPPDLDGSSCLQSCRSGSPDPCAKRCWQIRDNHPGEQKWRHFPFCQKLKSSKFLCCRMSKSSQNPLLWQRDEKKSAQFCVTILTVAGNDVSTCTVAVRRNCSASTIFSL